MQVPLDFTFENSEPSEVIRSEVEKQAKRLEKFHDRITSCNVAVVAPQARHRKGDLFKIDIRIAMPKRKDIIITKTHGDLREHELVTVTIRDAFGLPAHLEDAVREMRGQAKPHEAGTMVACRSSWLVTITGSSRPPIDARSISIATAFSIRRSTG